MQQSYELFNDSDTRGEEDLTGYESKQSCLRTPQLHLPHVRTPCTTNHASTNGHNPPSFAQRRGVLINVPRPDEAL